MMRQFTRLILPLLIAAASLPATAQDPAAAPVAAVTTTAVPTAAPDLAVPVPGIGQPNGGVDLQQPFTPIAREARGMAEHVIDPMMLVVSAFVLLLLGYTIFRFRAARNPTASRTSHNTLIEVIWTVVPVLILVWVAVPSFRLLANQYSPPKADITIKAIGNQWYWTYEYPDQGGFSFDSVMLTPAEAAKRGSPNLLDTDNRVVLPAGAVVKVLTTSKDVIHAWAVPSFWVQMDAVPGRVNETWFKVDRPGVYFGQCFQLCGTKHAFMPIAVEVVSKDKFATWVAAQQKANGITAKAPASGQSLGSPAAEAATAVTAAVPLTPPTTPAAITAAPATPAPAPAAAAAK